jgi:hypothetical protein
MRVGPSTLESFRLYLDEANDWFTTEKFIDQLLRREPPSLALHLGSAFGAVLERPERYRVPGGFAMHPRGSHRPFFFADAVMAEPLSLMNHVAGVFEAKATKRYPCGITVASKADQIVGLHLFEHKTTLGSFEIDKYLESVQWRFMVDLFEPRVVTYHVFLLDLEDDGGADLPLPALVPYEPTYRRVESFNLYPYATLRQDLDRLLEQFLWFVRDRGLVEQLEADERRIAALSSQVSL